MRTYKKPILNVEHFVPNEFVAACGDSGTVYKFECNAGELGLKHTYPYDVYQETNGQPGLQTGRGGDTYISNFHACGATHEAESNNIFVNGYIVDTRKSQDNVTDVIIWREPLENHRYSTHCTTNLDMDSWETAKS